MNNRNTGIIATIASALLCGCPGLFLCIFGAVTAMGVTTTELNGVQGSNLPATWGYAMLCGALILILIPVVIGVVTLRKKPAPVQTHFNDPLPPAS
jgi:ABC-type uncharacterized transport system permease subunit